MHRTAPAPPGPHPVCKKGGGAGEEEEQDSQGLSADVCPPYVHKSSNASQASTATVQSDFARTPNESNKDLPAVTFHRIESVLRKVLLTHFEFGHFLTRIPFHIFALLSKGHVELTKHFQRPFKASNLKYFVKTSMSGFVHSNILCSFSRTPGIVKGNNPLSLVWFK